MYVAIDLKSFYASVECQKRGLNPLTTHLVVADESRSEKTICLAVSPSLKALGIKGRPRLFEVLAKIKEENRKRFKENRYRPFTKKSYDSKVLECDLSSQIDLVIATPNMQQYIDVSNEVYKVYLNFVSSQDIHIYSIDEVFIDVSSYLSIYNLSAYELTLRMIEEVLKQTGITATAGIGTNLYLAKVAMDIMAKKMKPNENGVRIAFLDEQRYRKELWHHKPITDFWRVGHGYQKRLADLGLYTMYDIAKCSLGKNSDYHNEDLLYKTFGINAELLIDHAWGYESCTMKDIKDYKPQHRSLGSGQVLHETYNFEDALLVVKEMVDQLALDLTEKQLVTNQLVLTVGYDACNVDAYFQGNITMDAYGRKLPKNAHGSIKLPYYTYCSSLMTSSIETLFHQIVKSDLWIKRLNISLMNVITKQEASQKIEIAQVSIFDTAQFLDQQENIDKDRKREEQLQASLLKIKKKYGKNAILKARSFTKKATAKQRNQQIGGHKA